MGEIKRAVGYWRNGRLVHANWTKGWSADEHWLGPTRSVYYATVMTAPNRVVDVFVAN